LTDVISMVRDDRTAPTIVPLRRWGRWIGAALIVAAVVGVGMSLSQALILWEDIPDFMTSGIVLDGLLNTIILAVLAQVAGVLLGVVVAVLRLSRNPVARVTSAAWVWLFRGLPVLLQLYIWFNLALAFSTISLPIPFTDSYLFRLPTNEVMTPFVAAFLALALHESGSMGEIIRAGISSVGRGQTDAAQAIGMKPFTTFRRIVLPQAMRVVVPPTGNQFISMLKATSLASAITYLDVLHGTQRISARNLEVMEALLAAAAWYMVLVSVASVGQYYLERAYGASDREPRAGGGLAGHVVAALRIRPFARK
jgi:polar amino acid transport system permease protein